MGSFHGEANLESQRMDSSSEEVKYEERKGLSEIIDRRKEEPSERRW